MALQGTGAELKNISHVREAYLAVCSTNRVAMELGREMFVDNGEAEGNHGTKCYHCRESEALRVGANGEIQQ